jgi:hypothetical protein
MLLQRGFYLASEVLGRDRIRKRHRHEDMQSVFDDQSGANCLANS